MKHYIVEINFLKCPRRGDPWLVKMFDFVSADSYEDACKMAEKIARSKWSEWRYELTEVSSSQMKIFKNSVYGKFGDTSEEMEN